MNKKFAFKDIPIIRQFLDMFDTDSGEDKKNSKERALPFYKIYSAVDKQLQLAGTIDYEEGGYCNDVYMDQTGTFAIATKNNGKMYKAMVTVSENNDVEIAPWQEVITDFKPVVGRMSAGIAVERQADGKTRWYAWPACTAALNRSGEIDSRQLFDSFIENIERTGEYPELDFFHFGPELVLGRADHVFRDEYAYCATGLFYDTDNARAVADAIEADPEYWGNSIQYYPSEAPELLVIDGTEIPVYNAGVNRFISILPEDTAASILTAISTQGVARMLKKTERSALEKAGISAETIAALDKRSRAVNESLQDQITRQKTAKPAVTTTKKPAPAAVKPVKREGLQALVDEVLKHPEFKDVLRDSLEELRGEGEEQTPEELAAAALLASQEEGAEEGEETEVPEAEMSATERMFMKQFEAINKRLDSVDEIKERMDEMGEDEAEELRTILADMPAKSMNTKIVRPRNSRNSATAQPKTFGTQAESTLEKIRQNRVS